VEILKQLLGDIIPNHKRAATDRVSRMEAQPTILINLHEKEDKQFNRQLACQRITIEHVNRRLKIFKNLSLPYRNRRRFGLRCNLISAI
jgi:hypothetical protein